MRKVAFAAALVAAGCGGTSISGTVRGIAYDLRNGIWVRGPVNGVETPDLVFTSEPDPCQVIRERLRRTGYEYLYVRLTDYDGSRAAAAREAGTYAVPGSQELPPGHYSSGHARHINERCDAHPSAEASGGEAVVEDRLTEGSEVSGTVNLEFGQGDRLEGPFEAAWCDAQWPAAIGCRLP